MIRKIEHHNEELLNVSALILEFFCIVHKSKDAHNTLTFHLKPPKGNFSFSPGQFNMLYLFGVGEVPISISGDPSNTEYLVHTILAVATVTKELQKLTNGDYVGISGPFSSHWPT